MAQERVLKWARLNNQQLAALDRQQTILLLPMGHTQQFGPHLPHGTTTYAARHIAAEIAELLTLTDRQRTVVLLPTLPYGADPVENRRPDQFPLSSSLNLSPQTLEAIIIELTQAVVRNGFRYLFTIGHHAGHDHCRAILKAFQRVGREYPALIADDVYSYLYAGAVANAAPDLRTLTNRRVSPIEKAAMDTPSHGGTADTAIMLALDANLVATEYVTLEGIPEPHIDQMTPWPGYFGGPPSLAEADLGRAILTQLAYRATAIIRKAVDGESLADLPRYPQF